MKVYGLAEVVSYNTSGRAREFIIEINGSLDKEDKIRTLAHEMIHVKQLAKGTLKQVDGVNYWKGKRYRKNHKYLNLPWEIEAFSKQELLFRKVIER